MNETPPLDSLIDGFLTLLGAEITDLSPTRCVVKLPINETHHQPYGIVHGGVYCSLVETAASIGAVTAIDGRPAVGMTNTTDFLRPVREGTLTAVATPVHVGRSSQLWDVQITDDEGRLCARGRMRMFNMDGMPS